MGLDLSMPSCDRILSFGLKSFSQAHASRALYCVIFLGEIPYVVHALLGMILGVKRRVASGMVSRATASACGESFRQMWGTFRPNATRESSGEEKETAMSGCNSSVMRVSSRVLSTLASSLPLRVSPPCCPTTCALIPFRLSS